MRARAVPETPAVVECHAPERPTIEQAMHYLRQRVKASPQSIARFLRLADVETLVQRWSEVSELQPTPLRRRWTRPEPRASQPATPRRWARLTADNHVRSTGVIANRRELVALCRRKERGDPAARDELILRNIGLVSMLVELYASRVVSLTREDLFQEGVVGLIRAVDRFDYRRNCTFATYAVWWIRQAMSQAVLTTDRSIRVPQYIVTNAHRIQTEEERTFTVSGAYLTDEEVSVRIHLSGAVVGRTRRLPQVVSIDDFLKLDSDTVPIPAVLADPRRGLPEALVEAQEVLRELFRWEARIIAGLEAGPNPLSFRQRFAFCYRVGLCGFGRHTLDEVGDLVGVTRQRAQQYEARSYDRLQGKADVPKEAIRELPQRFEMLQEVFASYN